MSYLRSSNISTDDGRGRFGRNVAFAWGGYMVNIISGFIIPRMISDQLGQVTLGVWDFAWSFVAYFELVQLGMGSSISRYVAYYSSRNDTHGLNRSVSTIAVFQRSVGWLAFVLAVVTAWSILPMFATRLGQNLGTTRWVIILLGAQISIGISLATYQAVIVGFHRWDLHNTVSAASNTLVAFGMIAVLLLDGGLPSLALVHCMSMVGGDFVRWRLVKRLWPELRIERRIASWATFRKQARYSIKILIPSLSNIFSNQALSLLITIFLGPTSLAVFSRSRSLMSTFRSLAAKVGMIIIPTASALQAKCDRQALRDTLLMTTQFISCLMLPVLIAVGIFGEPLIRLWMGKAYVLHGLVEILCVGTYFSLVQEPVWCLLAGMNLHGRVALAKLVSAVGSALILTLGLWLFDWGLLGTAVCFVLPQMLVDGFLTPWYACQVVGVSRCQFFCRIFVGPVCCVLPYAVALGFAHMVYDSNTLESIGMLIFGFMVSLYAYSRWLIAPGLKIWIKRMLRRMFAICTSELILMIMFIGSNCVVCYAK